MSLSNSAETNLLLLIFNNTAWDKIGDASGLQPSAVAGSLYVALHLLDPGEGGNQSTSEIGYTGYNRVAVARSGAGWTVAGNQVANTATVQFGEMTAGDGGTATFFTIGSVSAGATEILATGQLTAPRVISNGITPLFNAAQLTGTMD